MIKAFFRQWVGTFRDGLGAARALPLLIVLMAALELAQHAVELPLGLFSENITVHNGASEAPLRLALGWPKMLALSGVSFFVTRWLVSFDAHEALRPPRAAVHRYVWVVLFQLLPAAVIIYARSITALLGIGDAGVMPLRAIVGLVQLLLDPFLYLWFVNAAMGKAAVGPIASAKTTGWLYFWALLLMLTVRLPIAQIHGRLNIGAVGQAPAIQWAMLALDALVVGVLAVIVPTAQVRIARYIADRRGVALLEITAPTNGFDISTS